MKKIFAVVFILLTLIGVATFEEIFLNNFLSNLKIKADTVSISINQNEEHLDSEKVKKDFEDLNNFWENSKHTICYFNNYEKIKSFDECFFKLSTAIEHNDSSLAIENISVIQEYVDIFNYTMGFNIYNLF